MVAAVDWRNFFANCYNTNTAAVVVVAAVAVAAFGKMPRPCLLLSLDTVNV